MNIATANKIEITNILPSYIINSATPSFNDHINEIDEKHHRIYGCELIQQAGTILNLPQVVMVTAQNIINRFYYRYDHQFKYF